MPCSRQNLRTDIDVQVEAGRERVVGVMRGIEGGVK